MPHDGMNFARILAYCKKGRNAVSPVLSSLKYLRRSRWFLVALGLAIIFLSIGYYPSLAGESRFAGWMELPIEAFGAMLVLLGLFRRHHWQRMRTTRTLLVLLALFAGTSYAYFQLDETGKIDEWLGRTSTEGTIGGSVKDKIPSLLETVRGLTLENPEPSPTVASPKPTATPTLSSRVWVNGAYIVGAKGNPIMLVNNPNARNPSWSELVEFLRNDPTDQQKYSYSSFVCADFAEMLHNNAERAGWRAAYVLIQLGPSPSNPSGGHALNAFDTTDRGLVFIDCTAPLVPIGNADTIVDVKVGLDYVPVSIFPQPGWLSTWESLGQVLKIEVIQW